jgi:hypothetical protein
LKEFEFAASRQDVFEAMHRATEPFPWPRHNTPTLLFRRRYIARYFRALQNAYYASRGFNF